MVFSAEAIVFGLYFAQQIGVLLAIGAQTIILAGYLLDTHAESFNEHLRKASRAVRLVGIALIILSGLGTTYLHFIANELFILEEPAFVFKWLLVVGLLGFHLLDKVQRGRGMVLWLEGGSWYALFLVHTLAPAISWQELLIAYGVWLLCFGAVWGVFVFLVTPRKKKPAPPVATVKPQAPATPPAPAPAAPLPKPPVSAPPPTPVVPPPPPAPVIAPTPVVVAKPPEHPLPALHPIAELPTPVQKVPTPAATAPAAPVVVVPEKKEVPMPDLEEVNLPAIHVMPKKPEDIGKHIRSSTVQFSAE